MIRHKTFKTKLIKERRLLKPEDSKFELSIEAILGKPWDDLIE